MDLFREKLADQSMTVAVDLEPDLPRVRIGEEDLKAILTNLVGNAIKYGRASGHVQVRAARRGADVCVEVVDNGIGIKSENLPRLFEEFFREKRPETRDIDGNGLGLAIVKRLAERSGGSIDVQSTVGVGSAFSVRLSTIENCTS